MAKKESTVQDQGENIVSLGDGKFSLTGMLTGTKEEFSKIVWPSRQQVLSESTAVVLMVILVSTVIYVVDQIFSLVASKVF